MPDPTNAGDALGPDQPDGLAAASAVGEAGDQEPGGDTALAEETGGDQAASATDGTGDREAGGDVAADGEAEAADSAAPGRGLRAILADEFSFTDAIGGWRGLMESVAPGLVFVVAYVIDSNLKVALIASVATAVVAVAARMIGRQPITQAVSGFGGVVIGAVWARLSGRAEDYFQWGFWVNGAYAAGCLISLVVRRPAIGLIVALLTGRWATWRQDAGLVRRSAWATWLWVAAFVARLAVQVPLYLAADVAWLGTLRLVMGVPMFALVLWVTWLLVRPYAHEVGKVEGEGEGESDSEGSDTQAADSQASDS